MRNFQFTWRVLKTIFAYTCSLLFLMGMMVTAYRLSEDFTARAIAFAWAAVLAIGAGTLLWRWRRHV